jgi:hypothetical protein
MDGGEYNSAMRKTSAFSAVRCIGKYCPAYFPSGDVLMKGDA